MAKSLYPEYPAALPVTGITISKLPRHLSFRREKGRSAAAQIVASPASAAPPAAHPDRELSNRTGMHAGAAHLPQHAHRLCETRDYPARGQSRAIAELLEGSTD